MGITVSYANAGFKIDLKLNVYMVFCDLFHINVKLQLSNEDTLHSHLPHVFNIKQAGTIWQVLTEFFYLPVYRRQYLYKSNPFCFHHV